MQCSDRLNLLMALLTVFLELQWHQVRGEVWVTNPLPPLLPHYQCSSPAKHVYTYHLNSTSTKSEHRSISLVPPLAVWLQTGDGNKAN